MSIAPKVNLHALAIDGKVDEMLLAFENSREDMKSRMNEETSVDGLTPLHYACRYGRLNVINLLIDEGANIHSKATNGYTPFLELCANHQLQSLEYVYERYTHQETPEVWATFLNEKDNNDNSCIHETVFASKNNSKPACISTIRFLLEHDADRNCR